MIPEGEPALPRGLFRADAEVFYSLESVLTVTPDLVAWLVARARETPRKRTRLCAHADLSAAVHEMIIVHHNDVYVRPHRHATKPESFHHIEGSASIVLFDDEGTIANVLRLDGAADAPFYFRIPAGVYHTFLVRSEWLVFHETTAGPFDRTLMECAPWSPVDGDLMGIARYAKELQDSVQQFLTNSVTVAERD